MACKFLCYWTTIHCLILKIYSVLTFKFLRSMTFLSVQHSGRARWVLSKTCAKRYILSMSNITKCIDKRFAIKNVGRSCLALTFNLNIPKMKTLHAKIGLKERFKVAGYHKTYTIFFNRSTWTYGSVVEASSREWKNGFNLCSSFAILHGTEPVSALIGYTIAIVEPLSILPQKAWPSRFSQLIQGDDYPSKVQKKRSPR